MIITQTASLLWGSPLQLLCTLGKHLHVLHSIARGRQCCYLVKVWTVLVVGLRFRFLFRPLIFLFRGFFSFQGAVCCIESRCFYRFFFFGWTLLLLTWTGFDSVKRQRHRARRSESSSLLKSASLVPTIIRMTRHSPTSLNPNNWNWQLRVLPSLNAPKSSNLTFRIHTLRQT